MTAIPTNEEILAQYHAALAKILTGQSYKMADGRELTRADLDAVQKGIQTYTKLVNRAGGGAKIYVGSPSRF